MVAAGPADIVRNNEFLTAEHSRKRQRISCPERQAEVLAVAGNLAKIHTAETQRLGDPHDCRDLCDLLIDMALRVEEVAPSGMNVEHTFAHLVVAAAAFKTLLRAIVDA